MASDNSSQKNRVKFADSWYDLGDFAKRHPGGQSFIRLFNGRDVTHAFRSHHPHFSDSRIEFVLQKVKQEEQSYAEVETVKNKEMSDIGKEVTEDYIKAYRELQKEVLKALGGFRKSKGTFGFFIKATRNLSNSKELNSVTPSFTSLAKAANNKFEQKR